MQRGEQFKRQIKRIKKKQAEAETELRDVVKKENMNEAKAGRVKFELDGYVFTIEHREDVVKVDEKTPPQTRRSGKKHTVKSMQETGTEEERQ